MPFRRLIVPEARMTEVRDTPRPFVKTHERIETKVFIGWTKYWHLKFHSMYLRLLKHR